MADTTEVRPGAEAWSSPGEGDRAAVGVVVTHGFTANPSGVTPLAERLADEGYAVEVPRLPGHGTTWRDLARHRYPDLRAELARVVELLAERVDRVVLVGHSLGGTLSLDVGAARQDVVAGIVAVNPQLLSRTDALSRFAPVLQHLLPVVPRELAGLPTSDVAKPGVTEDAYRFVPAKTGQSIVAELPRIRAQLAELTVPVLVPYAPQDHTVPPENARALAGLAPRAEVTELVLERSYHVALLDWDAELLADAVVEFVGEVTA